jgi:hypothetical protein
VQTQPAIRAPAAAADLDRALFRASAFFAVAVVLHNADHLRRGSDAVSADVFWAGTLAIGLEVLVVTLVCQRHRLAPVVATGAGFGLAAGYLVVHFLPDRPWLSDSFISGSDVSPLSWLAASLELVAAVALGVVGAMVIGRRGGLAAVVGRPSPVEPRAGLHPLALAFGLSQAVTLVIAMAQA